MTSSPTKSSNSHSSLPFFQRWVVFSAAHAGKIVLGFLLLALLAGWVAVSRIHLDADLESLLPKDSPTIVAMRETKARYGSTDLYTVSIVMNDPVQVAHLQDRVKRELQTKWPDVVFVQNDRDASFFRSHALIYLPTNYLDQLYRRLKSTRDQIRRGPLGVDLMGDDEPAPSGPWFDASLPQQLGLPDEVADEFEKFLKPPDSSTKNDRATADSDPKLGVPDSLETRLIGRIAKTGQYVGVVQAVLNKPSSDIEYVRTVLARSDSMLIPLRREFGEKLKIGVQGPYKDFQEVESLSSNGTVATVISIALTLLIVLLYFRASGPIFLVLGQASISCMLTLGFVGLTYGRLNLYTVFVIAILFGMGTDFSLYLVGYAHRLVRTKLGWDEALSRSLSELFSSLVAAATTTIAGLLTLLISRFAGFYEFGVIATFGISMSFILTYAFLPAALLFSKRLGEFPGLSWLRIEPRNSKPPLLVEPSWLPKFSKITALMMIGGGVALTPFAFKLNPDKTSWLPIIPRVEFEYDFAHLREDRSDKGVSRVTTLIEDAAHLLTGKVKIASDDLPVREALNSKRTSSQPIVVLAKNARSMDAIHDTLLRRLTVDREPMLRSFLTVRTFVPQDSAQRSKLPYLEKIGGILADPIFLKASGDDSAMVTMLKGMVEAKPFGAEEIPGWALNMLRERDGSWGRIGFIYGRFNSSDSREAAQFEEKFGHLEGAGEKVSSFASSFVYADVVRLVREDSMRMSIIMLALLVGLLGVLLRRWGPILVCLLGMAACLVWILGLMGLFGIKVGVFNLIVITTIQAALTDVVIYLVLAWERNGRKSVLDLYIGMGALMSVAIGTTIAGYAGMSFTTHLGIRSMGNFALVGLGACVLVSLGLTPWLCQVLLPPKPER